MTIPVIIFCLLAVGCRFNRQNWWAFGWLILFAIFIGFRDLTVGTDTPMYYNLYESLGNKGYNGYPEPLYGYSQVFFNSLGLDFWQSQFILFFVSGLFLWIAIKKCSPNYGFSIFIYYGLYFVMYATNGVRQIFAVSIVLCAYSFLAHGKKWYFIILILIACGFHSSCVIACSALFVSFISLNSNKKVILTILLSLIIGTLVPISTLSMLSGDYSHYLENVSGVGIRTESRFILAFMLCIFWSTLLIILLFSIQNKYKDNFWIKLYFIAILVNNICMKAELGLRVVWIFSIAEVIALPIIFKRVSKIPKSILAPVTFVYIAIFFFTLLLTNSARVCPYNNVLIDSGIN